MLVQTALKCLSVEPAELRAIKATCSKTRDSLVEAFTWWIHYAACTGDLAHLREEFIGSVVDKLADPRIHGDLLYVSRRFLDEPSFEAAVEAAAAPLIRAAKQLDRYSKVLLAFCTSSLYGVISHHCRAGLGRCKSRHRWRCSRRHRSWNSD
jgi:hypothetical protein